MGREKTLPLVRQAGILGLSDAHWDIKLGIFSLGIMLKTTPHNDESTKHALKGISKTLH